MRWLTSLPIFLGLAAVSGMPPQNQTQNQIAKRFVGAWRLVSIEGNPPNLPGFYDRPSGMIVYLASGQMAVQIAARADRKPFAPGNHGRLLATPEEKAAAFDSYLGYYGTYTVDGQAGTVTHHIEDYSVPGRRGTTNVRWFEFRGSDGLVLIPMEDDKGGVIARENASYKLFWERIK
jgi:hypothetical protein